MGCQWVWGEVLQDVQMAGWCGPYKCSGSSTVKSALRFCPYLSVDYPGTTAMGPLEIPADLT